MCIFVVEHIWRTVGRQCAVGATILTIIALAKPLCRRHIHQRLITRAVFIQPRAILDQHALIWLNGHAGGCDRKGAVLKHELIVGIRR